MSSPLRRRRTHAKDFKAMLVAQCQQPGASIAGVALAHQINDNLLRVWIRKAAEAQSISECRVAAPESPRIIPLQLSAPVESSSPIRIHIQHGDTQIHVEWPVANAALCRDWLQGWLR